LIIKKGAEILYKIFEDENKNKLTIKEVNKALRKDLKKQLKEKRITGYVFKNDIIKAKKKLNT